MKGILLAATVASLVAWAPAPPPPPLELRVITGSPQGFLVNSTLVTGARDAVLIDGAFTLADARKIVDQVRASGKNLTTVYVTHGHPDHYFGLVVIKEAFPKARFVALPATVAAIQQTWESKVAQWIPLYKDAITSAPVLPGALEGNAIMLEGQRLEIVGPVQGDDAENSYVWIPSLRAVITGDIVYSGVFVWTAETDTAARTRWVATLDGLTALHPAVVVPGHQTPEKGATAASIAFTREYLRAFDQALASATTPEQLQAKMKDKYPTLALDIILSIGAEAAFSRR